MSQFFKGVTAGSLPGVVATSYTTDVKTVAGVVTNTGSAIPDGNILDLLARDTDDNNDNGLRTNADANLDNNVYVELTNRATTQVTTTNNDITNGILFPLGTTPGVYSFRGSIEAFNSTDTEGSSYEIKATIRTTGAAGVEIGKETITVHRETVMVDAVVSSGVVANNFVIFVEWTDVINPNKTINWNTLLTYRFVS